MTNPDEELRSMPMLELVPAMLDEAHPRHVELVREVQRRWDAAVDQKARVPQQFGQSDRDGSVEPTDLIEEARQYLAVQTLIYELWVFQEARVEPDALWADKDAATRVFGVIEREHARSHAHIGPRGELMDLPDPFAAGAKNLAYWVDLAVFGDERSLINHQYRLAGTLGEDVLEQQVELCAQALAELDGPWSLPAFLANPVGKNYYRPHQPDPPGAMTGMDVALGRRGQPVTELEVGAVIIDTDMAIDAEARHVAAEGPGERPLELDPARVPREHLTGVLGELREMERFLTEALAVRQLAADDIARVEGRPVPRELLPWVMGLHRDAAGTFPPRLPGPITIAGMQVTFANNPVVGAVAVADVAGTVRQYALESLGGLLTILDQPPEDALTAIAKIRVHIDQLDRDLAAPNTAAAKRLRPVHDMLGERPKTLGGQRGHGTTMNRDSRIR